MKWVAPRSGFDEVFDHHGQPRAHYDALISILESFTQRGRGRGASGCSSSPS